MLIDEFQDTDPVQAELAVCSRRAPASRPATGASSTSAPGRLTVVGDPKQSIYRFRRADIAVYDQVRDGALNGGHEADLDELPLEPAAARRAQPVFNTVLDRQPGVQPGNVELDEPPGAPSARRPPVLALGELDAEDQGR